MGKADKALKNIVDPLLGKTSPAERENEAKLREQQSRFTQQARKAEEQERAKALEENIRRRKTSGTAVRRFAGLGGVGNVNSASNSQLG